MYSLFVVLHQGGFRKKELGKTDLMRILAPPPRHDYLRNMIPAYRDYLHSVRGDKSASRDTCLALVPTCL